MTKITIQRYIEIIDAMIEKGGFEPALNHCFYLLRQFPKMLSVYKRIGRIYYETGNIPGAFDVFSRIVSCVPDDFLTHITLSYLFKDRKEKDLAQFHLRTGLNIEPGHEEILDDFQKIISKEEILMPSILAKGLEYFREKKYAESALILSSVASVNKPLELLFYAESLLRSGKEDAALPIYQKLLNDSPYLLIALRSTAAYWHDKNQVVFFDCLEKLKAIDPCYEEYKIIGGDVLPGNSSALINYQDWTGFPNTVLRIGWQRVGEKIIDDANGGLPDWLSLLPVNPYAVFSWSEEKSQAEISDAFRHLFTVFHNMKAQTEIDLHKAFSEQVEKTSIEFQTAKEEKNPAKKTDKSRYNALNEAFSWLENLVQNSAQKKDQTANISPENRNSHSVNLAEKVDCVKTEEAQIQLAREAWNCFSIGDQKKGIDLYRILLSEKILLKQVADDLKKLCILFPENKDLSYLLTQVIATGIIGDGTPPLT